MIGCFKKHFRKFRELRLFSILIAVVIVSIIFGFHNPGLSIGASPEPEKNSAEISKSKGNTIGSNEVNHKSNSDSEQSNNPIILEKKAVSDSKGSPSPQQSTGDKNSQSSAPAQIDKAISSQEKSPATYESPSNKVTTVVPSTQVQQSPDVASDKLMRPVFPRQGQGQPPQNIPNQMARPPQQQLPITSGSRVSLNFDDADIYSVIQTVFGEILRVNYTVDPKIKGRVTFRSVAPVEKDKVLPLMEVIFRLNDIAIVEEGGLNRIVPISSIAREPVPIYHGRELDSVKGKSRLQVIPVKNMQSAEMVKLLTPFASEKAVIVNVPNTNQIIIVDTDSTVKRLLQLIEVHDTEQQKPRGAKVYVHHIQNGSAKEITELLQKIFLGAKYSERSLQKTTSLQIPVSTSAAQKISPPLISQSFPSGINRGPDAALSEEAKIVADENANTVIIYATPEEYEAVYEAVKEAIVKIDVTPRQVLIEATILDVILSDNLSLGVNALYKSGDVNVGLRGVNDEKSDLIPNVLDKVGRGLSILKLPGTTNLSLFITALAEKTKLKVLSAPHTIVSDSKEAEISIGDTIQIKSADVNNLNTASQTDTTTVTTLYQQKDVGTMLKVVPHIHEGGLVTMKISQEVSSAVGDIEKVQQGPIFHKTVVKNELISMDGETIVIGGLIREDTQKVRSGIPFLSSIPVVGWLFGGMSNKVDRRELIILITPRVIKNQQDAARVTDDYINRLIQGTKTGLTREEVNKSIPFKKKDPEVQGPVSSQTK
jgi:type II secretory pathway component GspD/PulD (secretin)